MLSKKIISLIIAVVCCFVFAFTVSACGNDSASGNEKNSQTNSESIKSNVSNTDKSITTPGSTPVGSVSVKTSGSNAVGSDNSITSSVAPRSSAKPEDSLPTPSELSKLVDITDISYVESLNALANPDRGFICQRQLEVGESTLDDAGTLSWIMGGADASWSFPNPTTLFIFSFGLKNYSSGMGGTDKALDNVALTFIRNQMEEIRKSGATAILRFSYDYDGKSYNSSSDNGTVKFNPEPKNYSTIDGHIQQIGQIVNDYKDVVMAIETGMFGPWGEQHSSTFSESNNVYFYDLLESWIKAVPDKNVPLLVRRPECFLGWYNKKYSKSYTTSNMSSMLLNESQTPDAMRIGCYNDGYLTSPEDWGTYTNRAEEVKWLSKLTLLPFGGEVCYDGSYKHQFNGISYMEVEAFQTHTNFLNYKYDYANVVSYWEKETYNGKDLLYKNANVKTFKYIENHLGYRLVLEKSKLYDKVEKNGNLRIEGTVKNVGFGNLTQKQNVYIVITDNSNKVISTQETSIDAQSFLSTQSVNYATNVTAPNSAGTYKVYMRVIRATEEEGSLNKAISFANPSIYNNDLSANYLGSFQVG